MKTSDFYYELPEELIAQHPAEPRDSSRLLVYDRKADRVTHEHFYDIVKYLKKGDVLVVNNTRVLPARLIGHRVGTGGAMEFLLLKRLDRDHWEALVKPGKKARIGNVFEFSDELKAEITGNCEGGGRTVRFLYEGVFEDILSRVGQMPLPPYIKEKLEDQERYQTVYSKENGSAAAPTAGLHFTPELLDRIRGMGVEVVEVLLHVGLGTFRPVKVDDILEHEMHSEFYQVTEQADLRAHAGERLRRERSAAPTERKHQNFHLSGLPIQVCGCSHYQLSPARIDPHHAGFGPHRQGKDPGALRAGREGEVSFFQLRRRLFLSLSVSIIAAAS